jgi:hypothetical protein
MKILRNFYFFGFLFLSITSATAQFGNNPYGNNGYGTGGGRLNGTTNMDNDRFAKSAETIEKERIESTNKSVEILKTTLNLDELQMVIVRKEVEESNKKIYALVKNNTNSTENISKEIDAITFKMDTAINSFLSKEQKEKYKVIIENRQDRMNQINAKK